MTQTKNLVQKKLITVKKIDLTGTLKLLNPGDSIKIKSKDAKTNTIHQTVRRLTRKGYVYTVTEAGLTDETLIIRIK